MRRSQVESLLDSLQHHNEWNNAFSIPYLFFFSDAPKEQSVFIMLNGEESELCFINLANPKVRVITSISQTLLFVSLGKLSTVSFPFALRV